LAYDQWRFLKGEKIEITNENKGTIEKLSKKVEIDLCHHNKDIFKLGEEVELYVYLKNIPTLFIKVFEINTENYYKKNMSPFKTYINLDGLIASSEL